jgi:hypothetical protein
MKNQSRLRFVAAAAAIPLALTVAATAHAAVTGAADTGRPGAPRLLRIAGLGGCEISMRIALSADESDSPSSVRYQVASNGAVVDTVHADTRGSRPGFGSLDAFASPAGGVQIFTIVAVDSDGNASMPSNAIVRNLGGAC